MSESPFSDTANALRTLYKTHPICQQAADQLDAVPALIDLLAMFVERIERHGNWDDGCFYYGATSASELQDPLASARAVLTSIGRTK
jgi:hypothetical protein